MTSSATVIAEGLRGKRLVVTGGTGFIGGRLVGQLIDDYAIATGRIGETGIEGQGFAENEGGRASRSLCGRCLPSIAASRGRPHRAGAPIFCLGRRPGNLV